MNLRDVEAFIAVAEVGSINRAARQLRLTQPATSRRIQNLESTLGAALLDRTVKPPILTTAGRQALEQCRRVLKSVIELKASVGSTGEPVGELRVGVAHGLADIVLSEPLDMVGRKYPKVRLLISSDWTKTIIDGVRIGELDCAVGLLPENHSVPAEVQWAPLGVENVVVVTQQGSQFPDRGSARDLSMWSWIVNPPGCSYRDALERTFDLEGIPLRVSAEILGRELQLSLAARGSGLALSTHRALDRSIHRPQLKTLRLKGFAPRVTIAMLRSKSLGNLCGIVDALEEGIAEHLSTMEKGKPSRAKVRSSKQGAT